MDHHHVARILHALQEVEKCAQDSLSAPKGIPLSVIFVCSLMLSEIKIKLHRPALCERAVSEGCTSLFAPLPDQHRMLAQRPQSRHFI